MATAVRQPDQARRTPQQGLLIRDALTRQRARLIWVDLHVMRHYTGKV